jgi:hypothetical protein
LKAAKPLFVSAPGGFVFASTDKFQHEWQFRP